MRIKSRAPRAKSIGAPWLRNRIGEAEELRSRADEKEKKA